MNPKIYFIIGVNGVGKSSITPFLKEALNSNTFIIHDFDERGVPDNADSVWRVSETLHWIKTGKENIDKYISTIICGFSKPKEIKKVSEDIRADVQVCLLDIKAEILKDRIMSRYQTPESLIELNRTVGKTPEKFISDNVWISSKFREESVEAGYFVIDTSVLNPEEVANKIIDWIN